MAARKTRNAPTTNLRIKCTKLLQRLALCGEGKLDLTTQQIKAIEVVTRKFIPDLKSIELSGPEGGPMQTESDITVRLIRSTGE